LQAFRVIIAQMRCAEALDVVMAVAAGWADRAAAAGAPRLATDGRFGAVQRAASAPPAAPPPENGPGGKAAKKAGAMLAGIARGLMASAATRAVEVASPDNQPPRWLTTLGDLEWEKGCHAAAVRLYMLAVAPVTRYFADRTASSDPQLLSPSTIQNISVSLANLGRPLPAAALLQLLPASQPERSGFRLLQAPPPPGSSDSRWFLPCVWEMPLLEVLLHSHMQWGVVGGAGTGPEAAEEEQRLVALIQRPS